MSATTASAATATTGQQQLDVCLVAQLCAIDPVFIGGVAVRSFAGPVRDRWLSDLRAMLDGDVAWRAVPVHVDDDRLLGGIDLAATLQTGRPVAQRGLLAEADGGVLLLAMAERMAGATAAHVAAALDTGIVSCARDGIAARMDAAFGVVALDESNDDDAPMNAALRDRLAFEVDLRAMSHRDCAMWPRRPTAAPSPTRDDACPTSSWATPSSRPCAPRRWPSACGPCARRSRSCVRRVCWRLSTAESRSTPTMRPWPRDWCWRRAQRGCRSRSGSGCTS